LQKNKDKPSAKMEPGGLSNGLGSSGMFNGRASPAGGSPMQYPMTNQLHYLQKTILPSMFKHKHSWPFHKPVDVVKLCLPVCFSSSKL
jgi:hypothetical protein